MTFYAGKVYVEKNELPSWCKGQDGFVLQKGEEGSGNQWLTGVGCCGVSLTG